MKAVEPGEEAESLPEIGKDKLGGNLGRRAGVPNYICSNELKSLRKRATPGARNSLGIFLVEFYRTRTYGDQRSNEGLITCHEPRVKLCQRCKA